MPLVLLRVSHVPRRAVCGNRGFFRTTHGGVSAPSSSTVTHMVAFEEGSGPRVLLKSGPGNRDSRCVEGGFSRSFSGCVRKPCVPSTCASDLSEALARDGVSREVPCSALKCETVPDTLRTTPKSSLTRRVPSRGTPRVPAQLHLSPFSPPGRDRRGDSPAWSRRGSRPSRRTSG